MHFVIEHFATSSQHWENTKAKRKLPLHLNLFTLQTTLIRPFRVNLCDTFVSIVGKLPTLSLHWTLKLDLFSLDVPKGPFNFSNTSLSDIFHHGFDADVIIKTNITLLMLFGDFSVQFQQFANYVFL